MRIFDIPFAYRADIVPPRHRTVSRVWVLDTVPVRIPELSSQDAPVVATWKKKVNQYVSRAGGKGASLSADLGWSYRSIDGMLARPWLSGMALLDSLAPRGNPVAMPDLQAELDRWAAMARDPGMPANGARDCHTWTLADDPAVPTGVPPGCIRRADLVVRQWVWSDADRKRAAVCRAMEERAAFVDGILHVGSSGPAWQVNLSGIDAMPEFSHTLHREMVFRGDRQDAALANCHAWRELLDYRGEREVIQPARGSIEIFDPVPFAAVDDIGQGASDLALKLVENAVDKVGLLHPDAIARYSVLKREAMAAFPDGRSTVGSPRDPSAHRGDVMEAALGFEADWNAWLATQGFDGTFGVKATAFARRVIDGPMENADEPDDAGPAP